MGTYRVDEELYAAVAAKAAERGETVTDLIIERFWAYIRNDEAAGIGSTPPVAKSPVYTVPEELSSYEEPPAERCQHPVDAVDGDHCHACHTDIW